MSRVLLSHHESLDTNLRQAAQLLFPAKVVVLLVIPRGTRPHISVNAHRIVCFCAVCQSVFKFLVYQVLCGYVWNIWKVEFHLRVCSLGPTWQLQMTKRPKATTLSDALNYKFESSVRGDLVNGNGWSHWSFCVYNFLTDSRYSTRNFHQTYREIKARMRA